MKYVTLGLQSHCCAIASRDKQRGRSYFGMGPIRMKIA